MRGSHKPRNLAKAKIAEEQSKRSLSAGMQIAAGAGGCDSLRGPGKSTLAKFLNSVLLQRAFDYLNVAVYTFLQARQNGVKLFEASQDVG